MQIRHFLKKFSIFPSFSLVIYVAPVSKTLVTRVYILASLQLERFNAEKQAVSTALLKFFYEKNSGVRIHTEFCTSG